MNIRSLLLPLFALVLAACGTVTPGYTVVAVDLTDAEARAAAIQKWDGKMPTSVMGGDVPFIMGAR